MQAKSNGPYCNLFIHRSYVAVLAVGVVVAAVVVRWRQSKNENNYVWRPAYIIFYTTDTCPFTEHTQIHGKTIKIQQQK